MTDRPKLSVVMNCAREGHSLPDHPTLHLFTMIVRELAKQKQCPPFELVVADTEYDDRRGWFVDNPAPFPVKHVPVRGYWSEHNCCQISHAKNESVIHAEGQWIVTVDDGTIFAPGFLHHMSRWLDEGVLPCALYDYSRCAAERIDDRLLHPRVKDAFADGGPQHIEHKMTAEDWRARDWPVFGYGFVGFTAEAFYKVNGYCEWFDGGRGQEDIEYSLRLLRAGHTLCYDGFLWAGILDQGPVATRFRSNVRPDGSAGWLTHCTSGLAPLLFAEIAEGIRTQANAERFPDRLLRQLYPKCTHYIGTHRGDESHWRCDDCGATVILQPHLTPADGPICVRCPEVDGERVRMEEIVERRREHFGLCRLYMDPCPWVNREGGPTALGTRALADYTDRHGVDPLYQVLVSDSGQFVRNLQAEHDALAEGPIPKDATYVGCDWRKS